MVSEMQGGWDNPSRFILGHPFNPPHLIPLVELLANDRTDEDVLVLAEAFYRQVGKVTIRVQREVPGHVANRLQAALWREAIHLVESGVASVEDVDKAVWAGPGSAMGRDGAAYAVPSRRRRGRHGRILQQIYTELSPLVGRSRPNKIGPGPGPETGGRH